MTSPIRLCRRSGENGSCDSDVVLLVSVCQVQQHPSACTSGVGPTQSRVRARICWLRTWAELVMPSPEQAAGKGGQRRVEAHQLQPLQLGLGRQQPIEGIPVGLLVTTGVHTVMQLHGQRL